MLLAFRDEHSTTWQTLTTQGAVTFDIPVSGPYRIALACGGRDPQRSVYIAEFARTPDDDAVIDVPCSSIDAPFTVTGTVIQPGEIYLGNYGRGTSSANWTLSIPAAAGPADLVMMVGDLVDNPFDTIAIRRDVMVTGDLDLGVIDASQGAQPLLPLSFTASNLRSDEQRSASVLLDTGSTHASIGLSYNPTWDVQLVPKALLRTTDHQSVSLVAAVEPVSEGELRRTRAVSREYHVGDSTNLTLPQPLDASLQHTSSSVSAAWSTLPEAESLVLEHYSIRFSPSPWRRVVYRLALTRSFLEQTHATSATLDVHDLPGFMPAWEPEPTADQVFSLSANRTAGSDELSSSIDDAVWAPTEGEAQRASREQVRRDRLRFAHDAR